VADDRSEYPAKVARRAAKVQRLARGPVMISNIEQGKDGRLPRFTRTTIEPEIYAFENGELRVLTHHNDELFAGWSRGTEEFSCIGEGRNEVHGLMLKPPDYVAGKNIRRFYAFTRTERATRTRSASTPVVRGERVCGAGGELSRQLGAREKVSGRDLGGLGIRK